MTNEPFSDKINSSFYMGYLSFLSLSRVHVANQIRKAWCAGQDSICFALSELAYSNQWVKQRLFVGIGSSIRCLGTRQRFALLFISRRVNYFTRLVSRMYIMDQKFEILNRYCRLVNEWSVTKNRNVKANLSLVVASLILISILVILGQTSEARYPKPSNTIRVPF